MRLGKANRLALRVALIYVSVAFIWHFVSAPLFEPGPNKAGLFVYIDLLKDCGFAAFTGGLIYWLLTRSLRRWGQEAEKRQATEAVLAQSNSLLNSTLESTADGILVVDDHGKITSFNQKFLRLWQIPAALAASKDDRRLLDHVITQLAEPDLFLAKVQELYHNSQAESWDELKFRDGRVFERYSKPQRLGQSTVGRVWSFRDITKRKQAEAKLLESEDRFRSIIEGSSLGIYVNLDMKFAYVNPAALRMLGAEKPEQLLGQSFLSRVHPDYHDRVRERAAKVFQLQENAPALEEVYLRLDGTSVPVEVSATTIRYKGQNGVVVYLQDVTQRSQVAAQNRALARLAGQLSVATDSLVAAEAVAETALELFTWDACYLLRYDAASKTTKDLIFKDTIQGERVTVPRPSGYIQITPGLQHVMDHGAKLLLRQKDTDYAGITLRFGDTTRVSRSLMYVALHLHGEVIGFLSVQSYRVNAYSSQDLVTLQTLADHCAGAIARIEAEVALRVSEARYALAEQATNDGLWDLDLLTDELDYSPRWKEIVGYQNDDVPRHRSFFLERLHPDDLGIVNEAVRRHLEQNEPYAVEFRLRHKDGCYRTVFSRAKAVRDATGRPVRMVGSTMDITASKQGEIQTRALAGLSERLSIATDIQVAAEAVTDTAWELLHWDACFLFRYDAATDTSKDLIKDTVNGERVVTPRPEGSYRPTPMLRRVIEQGGQLVLRQNPEEEACMSRRFGDTNRLSASLMLVGLRLHGKVIGFLSVQSYQLNAYTKRDLATLQSLADHCAGAITRIDAEAALRASEARYALTERAVADGMWDWNILTGEDVFSPRWKGILGYRDDELANHKSTFLQLVHPDDRARVDEATRGHLEAGKPYALEIRLRHKDGSYRWIYTRGEAIRDAAGQAVRMFGATTDITERKQLEAQMVEKNRFFELLVNLMPNQIFWKDSKLVYQGCNREFAKVVGLASTDQVVGKTDFDFARSPYFADSYQRTDRQIIASGVPLLNFEEEFHDVDGNVRNILTSKIPIRDLHGNSLGVLGVCVEITERKHAETALKSMALRHQKLLQTGMDGIHVLDEQGNVVEANSAFAAQLGYTLEEVMRLNVADWDVRWSRAELLVKIAELMKQPAVFETRHRRKDGSIIEVEISSNGVALDGSPFLYNAARDISARKQIEARIQRLNRTHAMLSEINQAIVHEPEPQTLFTTACAIAVETGKFRMAWIGKVDTATQRLEPVAAAGVVEDYPKLTQIDLQDATRNDGPAGRCVRKGEPAVCNNIERDPAYRPWRDEALKRGYRSSAGFPLKLNGQVVGVFNFYASEPEFFDDEELRLLDDLAADISFALSVNESQARYKAIFENAPDAVFLLAADGEDQGRILACNHLAEQQRGFAPGELAGKNISELTTGNSAALVPGRVRRVAAGESMVFEVEHRRKDGSTFPVEVTCARMLVANRPCVIAFDRDISERQQALAALAESQLLYQSLVTQLPIGIFLKDQLGRYVFVNPAFCQIHSLPETAFLGKTVLEVAMNDRAKPQGSTSTAKYAITGDSHFQQIMLTGKPIQSDEEYELADGTMRHLSAMKFPILKADGRIAGIQAVIFDITERKRADEAHARLAMLVEQATESIVITDAKGIITYVNPAFEKTSGYASAEARGCVKSRPFV